MFFNFSRLAFKVANEDKPWVFTEEAHTHRRQEILRKHPEIKKLMGYSPRIAFIVLFEFLAQMIMCWIILTYNPNWVSVVIAAYVIGGTLNHSLGSAIHEIGHNLAFGHRHPLRNRALGMFANLPMVVPMSVSYKIYHSDHHRYLGHDSIDADVPTVPETYLFNNPATKILWLFIHPLLHGIRPFLKSPKPVTILELINIVVQFTFDFIIFYIFGQKAFFYLLLGTFFGLGLHPLAGHFISEHYLFSRGQATHSYYGPLNPILFNVGYHVEHHDFPYVPYHLLPEVKRLAPEFYDHLPYHTSWLKVLWRFIVDPLHGPKSHGVGLKLIADGLDIKK
ncbi:unnamed protein product [Owenia fusiformis]|uniref:Uncharacterized protein n=1 Tax=Owenia fusiformis TaxID=6347 RepID=A0A8J1TW30_OWEFU|nr:unnamed protein product [Owenia fusiformis]